MKDHILDFVTRCAIRSAKIVQVEDDFVRGARKARKLLRDRTAEYDYLDPVFTFVAAMFRVTEADADQLQLGLSEEEHDNQMSCRWWNYLRGHVEGLCQYPSFVHSLVLCVSGQRFGDPGDDALVPLLDALNDYFGQWECASTIRDSIAEDCRRSI